MVMTTTSSRPLSPQQVVEQLLPDPTARQASLQLLADSIVQAHQAAPGSWALTLSRRYLRLDVGRIEAVTITRENLHLVLYRRGGKTVYSSVSGSTIVDLPSSEVVERSGGYLGAHRKLVAEAAATLSTSTWAASHSPEALDFVARATGRTLPRPRYQAPGASSTERAILADRPLAEVEADVRIIWPDTPSIDVIPFSLLAGDSPTAGVHHVVREPDGSESEAKCRITVRGLVVELNYEPFPEFNLPRDMHLGVARLTFKDSDRTDLCRVEWKGINSRTFKTYSSGTGEYGLPPSPPYQPTDQKGQKAERLIVERPEQAKFRRNLKIAYRQTCCMSGCPVSEALEAAHIDPYCNERSNNLKNGLLLRRDLHALFDAHLISINPNTGRIHVAAGARIGTEYKALHHRTIDPPSDSSHAPDPGALERHWQEHIRKFG
jgi:hypothetical protein